MPRALPILVSCTLLLGTARAAINVPGANGSDGALNVTTGTTTIDLSLAPYGAWDSASPTPGRGVYDGNRWAVVFHYSSVNIGSNATVAFKNNAARAPVVWLVSGDVTISGTINLDGGAYNAGTPLTEPGPGGFGGGKPNLTTGVYTGPSGAGWGPGGGGRGINGAGHNGPGTGTSPGAPYGTAQVIPLMGGSGAGGNNVAGGAGGGAILIAATGTITVAGTIRANGGIGGNFGGAGNQSASGSGGAIRLVADTVAGSGTLSAAGGITNGAANGRVRIEGNSVAGTLATVPLPSAGRPADPALIWPADTAPSVRIVSVGSHAVPSDPHGQLNAAADVLPDIVPGSLPVVIETRNIPTTSQVSLRVAPLMGDPSTLPATLSGGDAGQATWTVNVNFPAGSTSLQVRVEP